MTVQTAWSDRVTLWIDRVACFTVDRSGRRIDLVQASPELSPVELDEFVLGPPAMLALAFDSVFTLHASAVELAPHGAVLFVGDSGAGKSTLAGELWNRGLVTDRLSDDVLPTAVGPDGSLYCMPAYPQLKLPLDEQWAGGENATIPIRAVFRLEPIADGQGRVHAIRQTPRAALLAFASHTVASRLFDRELLSHHLDYCARAAAAAPGFALRYPHRRDAVEEVAKLLPRLLGGGKES